MGVWVYVLESDLDGTWYVGMSADVDQRLQEHNSGKSKFTKGHRPWKVIYLEEFEDYSKARVREKELKTTSGKMKLRKSMRIPFTDETQGSLPE